MAIHHMGATIVFDEEMTVHDVIAVTDSAPYADCNGAPATLKSLIGLRLSSGWSGEAKRRLSGAASCVHSAGLMVPMAATAFQSMTVHRLKQADHAREATPPNIDSCFASKLRETSVRGVVERFRQALGAPPTRWRLLNPEH